MECSFCEMPCQAWFDLRSGRAICPACARDVLEGLGIDRMPLGKLRSTGEQALSDSQYSAILSTATSPADESPVAHQESVE